MPPDDRSHLVTTPEALAALFGPVAEPSVRKEVGFLHPHYQAMIAASPFALLATAGPSGLDVSPRGDAPGFVAVEDAHTLLLPERPGNNRVDSLRNLLDDPRVALLFLIPGVGETLRVNGRAAISVDPALLARFAVGGRRPRCVLVIRVETAFFQCARAIRRSRLWAPPDPDVRERVPTPGAILEALTDAAGDGTFDGAAYDRALPARQRDTLY
jgi:PPOX class probable FMN-dependent enzyme